MKNNKNILQGDLIIIRNEQGEDFITEGKEISLDINTDTTIIVYPKTIENVKFNVFENVRLNVLMTKSINTYASLERNASANFSVLCVEECESNFKVDLNGEGSEVKVDLLAISDQVCKINQEIYHNQTHTNSQISNFGVAVSEGKIYFETIGKIINKMHNSNCRQLSKGLILGENAVVSSKPILLIDEYDVEAYHGASIGKMNEDDLFYLMSRGLSKSEAYQMVLEGIISPFLNQITDNEIKVAYYEEIHSML